MDTQLYAVYQDGRPLHRGLSRKEAERYADYLARGYESHTATDTQRVAEFEVKLDHGMMKQLDDIYRQ
jgi:hypothetical protein